MARIFDFETGKEISDRPLWRRTEYTLREPQEDQGHQKWKFMLPAAILVAGVYLLLILSEQ